MSTIAELVREAYSHWDDAAALARAGRELHYRNRLDLARGVLERALELDASNPENWEHLGYTHIRGYDPGKGFEVLRRGIERTGSDRLRATLAAATQDPEEKKTLLARVAGSRVPAVRATAASARLWAGEEAALGEIRRIQEEHPDDPDIAETWIWTAMNARFRGMAKDMDLREAAVPLADRKIREHPDEVVGYWMRANLLLAEKDWDALLDATAAALQRFPDEETMMSLRGRAFREKGDLDRAAHWLARAIGAKASFAGARAELGRVYEAQGRLEAAEEILREIPRVNPGFAGGIVALAAFLARRSRWDEAEGLFLDAWSRMQPWQRARLRPQPDLAPLLARERVKSALG